jgi:hypothetical protein
MAYTVTRSPSAFGNKRVEILKIVADAATQTVQTSLGVIEGHSLGYGSMSTIVGPKIFINSNASGVQSFGVLGCSGFTSGDEIYVTVFGR